MATAPIPGRRDGKPPLVISVGGIDYPLRFEDLNPVDAADVRRATGLSLSQVLDAEPDLDTVGILYWLARRKGGDRKATFEACAQEITYDAVFSGKVTIAEVVPDELEDDAPEV